MGHDRLNMVGRGAKITNDKFDQIVGYLATTFL
jgi:hypothetical protein